MKMLKLEAKWPPKKTSDVVISLKNLWKTESPA